MGIDVLDTDQAGQRIVRGGMLRTASYVGGIVVGLIATPLLTRQLGPEGFGLYNTVTSLAFICVGLTEAGLLAIGIRELATRDADGRREFMRDYIGMRIVLVSAAAAAMVGFALLAGYPHAVFVGALIAAAGFIPTAFYDVYTVPLHVQLRLGWTAALEFVRQLVTTAAIVVLVVVGAGLYPFFTTTALASAAGAALAWRLTREDVSFRPRFVAAGWWELMRDAIPFTLASAMAILYYRVAVVLMSLLSSASQTGYFSVSFRVIEIGAGLPWLLVSSALPLLTRTALNDAERMRYAMQRLFEGCAILGAGAALVVAVGAPVAVDIIAGDEFEAAVDPLRILGIALLATFFVALWGNALLSVREHGALLAANGSALVVALTLTIILAPEHGALGGAIATAATEVWLAVVYAVVVARRHPGLRPQLNVLGPLLLGLAAAAAPAILLQPLPGTLLAAAAYAGVLLLTRAVPRELFDALRRADRS